MKSLNKTHKGQVALIMVLIMTVVSAVAVSVASRSTTETRIQQQDVESREALLTAQSGIENALNSSQNIVTGNVGTGTYEVTKLPVGANGIVTDKVSPGEQIEVNLSGANISGVQIYWKGALAGDVPAIFVSDVQSGKTVDYAHSADAVDQTHGFTPPSASATWDGINWNYTAIIPITSSSKILRVLVLGKSAILGFRPDGLSGVFPPQTNAYKSIGTVSSSETAIKYGIEYEESITNLLPGVFDYALFTMGSIVQ